MKPEHQPIIFGMAKITVEIPDLVHARLSALSTARKEQLSAILATCLQDFAASPKVRREIRNARQAAGNSSLADLGWLDGYEGESVDELMSYDGSETPDVLLMSIEEGLHQRIARERVGNWTGVERMVLSIMALQREVGNGGFDQFFRNTSMKYGAAIADDLRRIGCTKAARIAAKAVKALRLEQHFPADIEKAMSAPDPRRDEILHECDEAFWQLDDISSRLLEYVRKHVDAVRL